MIRQAISCDICASEKRQTNHWFVAYEQAGELRVSGWSSRHRLRPGAKHLCGQTCLHKLVDEFMAKSIAVRAQRPVDEAEPEVRPGVDASLTSAAAHAEPESSARLIAPPVPAPPKPGYRPQPELVTMPARPHPRIPLLSPKKRRAMLRAVGAPKPGNANANANCAPSRIVPTSPRAAAPALNTNCKKGGPYVDRSDLGASGSASIPFQETASRGQFRSYPRLSQTPAVLSGGVYSASSASKPASSRTGTPSSRALSSFVPASSPATT